MDTVLPTRMHIGNPRCTITSVSRAAPFFACWFFVRGAAKQPVEPLSQSLVEMTAACTRARTPDATGFRFEGTGSTRTIMGPLREGPVCLRPCILAIGTQLGYMAQMEGQPIPRSTPGAVPSFLQTPLNNGSRLMNASEPSQVQHILPPKSHSLPQDGALNNLIFT